MRHTKGKRNRVRSHHALGRKNYAICSHCKADMISHTVCAQCGYYNGRQVVDVLKKANKKDSKKKQQQKEEHAH